MCDLVITSNHLTDLISIIGGSICCQCIIVFLLMALSRGQDDIPRLLDDMNSFLGEEYTMTCPNGTSPFIWYVQNFTNSFLRMIMDSVRIFSAFFNFLPDDPGHLSFSAKGFTRLKNKQVAFVIDNLDIANLCEINWLAW